MVDRDGTCPECGERMPEGASACDVCGAGAPAGAPPSEAVPPDEATPPEGAAPSEPSSTPWRTNRRRSTPSPSPTPSRSPTASPTPDPTPRGAPVVGPTSVPATQWPLPASPHPLPPAPAPHLPLVSPSETVVDAAPGRARTVAPLVAAAVLALVAAALAVTVLRGDDPAGEEVGAARDGAAPGAAGVDDAASEGETGDAGAAPAGGGGGAPAAPILPVSATATGVRSGTTLCTGEAVDYLPVRLIDGDPDTGWGAAAGDGTGHSATVDLGGSFRLTEIGLTPGFIKVGPRRDTGCRAVEAFPRNRWVPRVEYRFDDGTTMVHSLDQVPQVQVLPVDVVTTTVTITILETVLPPGADDDTILSEATFTGSPA